VAYIKKEQKMAKASDNNTGISDLSNSKKKEELVLQEVRQHEQIGFQETDRRATGRNRIGSISFNEADELFRSWIDENKWPYDALLFDPRVFTFIFEKTSRLIANKPKGNLIPRDGADTLRARINNQLLDYQWDQATNGGSMISKWSLMDINARKYGAGFALTKWRYECAPDGTVLFDGPEMQVLNNRDIAHDLTATSIESCNWFQVRQYVTVQDLQYVNDQNHSKPIYKNLDKLKFMIETEKATTTQGVTDGGDTRATNWVSRNRTIAGLETDPYGKDGAFKTIEIITEYRKNRWITFTPKYQVIIRDIPNPYKNNELPIVMLRYYAIDDDLYGLSEIEPIKGIQKAINAILCQYVDEINQQLYSPIAVGPGVRQHTLEWGKGARWIMNNPMTDFRLVESRSNAAQYFNNTYSALVAAMMNALGESSLGISNVQPYQKDKTATEIKALQLQRNARDNYNQIFLAEAIKRQYMLWYSMNQLLLFSDPEKQAYIMRIADWDALRYFTGQGLDDVVDNTDQIVDFAGDRIIDEIGNGGEGAGDAETQLFTQTSSYKYPVNIGTGKEKNFTSKLSMDEGGRSGLLYITPEDLKGQYDIIIDVQSMTSTADDEKRQARQAAVSLLATNPNVAQMLAAEGFKPKFKELFTTWLEDLGFNDADRYFEKAQPPAGAPAPGGGAGGLDINSLLQQAMGGGAQSGIPGGTNPNSGGEAPSASPFASGGGEGLGPVSPKAVASLSQ